MRAAPKAARKPSDEAYVHSEKHKIERLLYQNRAFFSGLLMPMAVTPPAQQET
jgi:hypothetical protein